MKKLNNINPNYSQPINNGGPSFEQPMNNVQPNFEQPTNNVGPNIQQPTINPTFNNQPTQSSNCSACGAPVNPGERFCMSCGKQL